jgi:hypothetical protein
MDTLESRRPGPAVVGTCVGFEIRSSLAFSTLRRGGGTPLEVDERPNLAPDGELLLSWQRRPENPFEGRLIRMGSRFAFWAGDVGWYIIDPDAPSITMTSGPPSLAREIRLFGVPASVCSLARGDLSIHASAVEVGGGAVLLAGPSRAGKTTLAAAFAAAGHRLLTEDSTRVTPGESPMVHPGPAAVRLRADVAADVVPVASRARPAAEGRIARLVDADARGSGEGVPLHAIVFLRAGSGRPTLEPADTPTAIRDTFALTFHLPSPASRAATFSALVDLVGSIGSVNLTRPVTIDALPDVIHLLEDHVASRS